MWLIVTFALVASLGVATWRLHARGRLARHAAIGSGAVLVALALATFAVHIVFDGAKRRAEVESLARTIELTALRSGASTLPLSTTPNSALRPVEAAPVSSLVAGLERRLANESGDAKDWALLAQSYAFIGNDKAAQSAMRRAVELGADEQTLRARVQAARRDRPPADSILHAFGG